MKKLWILFVLLVLSFTLVACGGKDGDNGKKANSDEEDILEVTDPNAGENKFFQAVKSVLEENDYEITEYEPTAHQVFLGATQAVSMIVNGEDMLTLQLYNFDPKSEYAKKAKETGKATIEYAGEKVDRDVIVIGDHYGVFMSEGHPDRTDIFKLLKDTKFGVDEEQAVNDDETNSDAEEPAGEETTGEIQPNEFGELIDPASVNNEYFINVVNVLKEAGYEVGELAASDFGYLDAKQAAFITINEEVMLPLQMYEVDPANENLAKAKETGNAVGSIEGMEFDVPVLVIDHYYFYLESSHPNYAEVYKLLEEKLK